MKKQIFIGIVGGFAIYLLSLIIDFFVINNLKEPDYLIEQEIIISNMQPSVIILYLFLVLLSEFFEDILFRGVIHNGLGDYFNLKKKDRSNLRSSNDSNSLNTVNSSSLLDTDKKRKPKNKQKFL